MSRAVVFQRYGEPEVLEVVDVGAPEPGRRQVTARVEAAGLQPFDSFFRSGRLHNWMPATFPQRLGNEFAGVIEAVGPDVLEFKAGDEVLGWAPLACHAEHVLADVGAVVSKPPGMPWAEAGVLSASGQTAATALRILGVGEGDTVLVHGASGGVGTFAVQIARANGAQVIGTASEPNHGYLEMLGAVPVVYGDGLADRVKAVTDTSVTAALDNSGTVQALKASLDLVADRTRIGTISSQAPAEKFGIRRLSTERSTVQLGELTGLHTAGLLRAHIQETFPLEAAADAHRVIDTGHVRGKLVLVP